MLEDELAPVEVFALLVNTCMGIGFLAIPYSTLHFGLLAAVIVTLGLGALAIFTGLWVTTTLSLTWALTRSKGDVEVSARTPVTSSEHQLAPVTEEDNFDIGRSMQMSYVKVIGMLYGDSWQKSSLVALAVVLVISMWSYASIFASSMAAVVPTPFLGGTCDVYSEWVDPTCASRYWVWLSVFALLMVALSLSQLREQKKFQLAMTACRIVLGLAIVGDCLRMLSLGEAPPHPGSAGGDAHVVPVGGGGGSSYNPDRFPSRPSLFDVDFSHGAHHIALATTALTVHMVIPDAIHDLTDKRRTLLPTVGAALAFCAVVYCLLSSAVVATFGSWTRPVCTLNWVNYTAGQPEAGPLAIALRLFIIIMPVFDVVAAYPILAQSLASNLQAVLSEEKDSPPWYARLICAMVPLVGAVFVYDAAETLGWVGVLLVPFVFILPQVLLLKADDLCMKEFGEKAVHTSTYWRWFCDRHFVWAGLLIGSVLSAVTFVHTFSELRQASR